jgi:glycosyltransferase involved in cell wall biosynthesis
VLSVLHILRAPIGGLFRHVRDLVPAQHGMGLRVGVVCDSSSADRLTEERLDALRPSLALGLHKIQMSRAIGLGDASAYRSVLGVAAASKAEILHGHGAKGGAYARLASAALRKRGERVTSFYTPHGGSLNFPPVSIKGRIYMELERRLEKLTGGIVFESAWSERIYRAQVCEPACPVRVIPNGLLPADFVLHAPRADAVDVVYVGELRYAKGVDLLIEAIAAVRKHREIRALIVGDGPDAGKMRERAAALGLADCIVFPGAMPARQAFDKGRVLAIPSRWESFPYIVLEAAAAGIPMIATSVGGIPEITAGTDSPLIPPGDVNALAEALTLSIEHPDEAVGRARRLRAAVEAKFTVERMTRDVVDFYRSVSHRTAR